MTNINKNYYLVKKDIITGDKEFFNFETLEFGPNKEKGVALATIDALTTIFEDGQELDLYFDRSKTIERDYEYIYKIEARSNNKSIEKTLNTVWDNEDLNALTKLTEGEVDFTGTQQYVVMKGIFDKLSEGSLLGTKATRTKKEDYRLSENAKKAVIAAYSGTKEAECNFFQAFKSYEDARALYLLNKNYQEVNIKDIFAKIKTM